MATSVIPKSLASDINTLNSNTNGIFNRAPNGAVSDTDLNTLVYTGNYFCTTGCTNAPTTYINLLVINSNAVITQFGFHSNDTIYLRRWTNADQWGAWRKLTTTAI